MLLLCALVAGSASVWGETKSVTYTVTSTSAVSVSGTAPTGSSATYSSTYTTKCQLTKGNSMTLTLSGYEGYMINGITLSMHSNKSAGSGSFTATAGETTIASIATAAFNDASWHGAWSQTWVDKVVSMTNDSYAIKDGEKVVITIAATVNSLFCQSFTLTYEAIPSGPVAVTGVSLDKTTLDMEVGGTASLTPMTVPAYATDQVVTWSSSNEEVATVDSEGNVTAEGAGSATITVTTHDGGFTATCDVTVTPAPIVAATLDFTSNTVWQFPTSKTVEEKTYTNGLSITLKGSTGNGFYFDSSNTNLLLGKNGATLTLPAFPFNVSKIKVFGDAGASKSVTFNIYVGSDAVSTEATSSLVDHEFEIDADKQAAGTIYKIQVTNDNNMRISKIQVFGYTTITLDEACTDGEGNYYGTYSNSSAFSVPEGLTVSTVSIADSKLTKTNYAVDDVVKANTGVLVSATTPGAKTIQITTGGKELAGNMLKASSVAMDATETEFFRLTMHNGTQIGFWWGAEDGAAFSIGANKAYLAVPAASLASGVRGFSLGEETDGISAIDNAQPQKSAAIYDLSGRRVVKPTKGLYIVNGKKVVK